MHADYNVTQLHMQHAMSPDNMLAYTHRNDENLALAGAVSDFIHARKCTALYKEVTPHVVIMENVN